MLDKSKMKVNRSTIYDKLEESAPRFFPRKNVCMTLKRLENDVGFCSKWLDNILHDFLVLR